MRRWTDGKSWSASRVSGSFLTYREMEGKRGGNTFATPAPTRNAKTPDSGRNSADEPADGEEGPDGYRYKPDGLMKQSFSITTNQGQHLHLISYYSRTLPGGPSLRHPSNDPSLLSIQIPKGMYPESSVNDQSNTPAVTRSPMPGAPNYAMAASPSYARPPPPPPAYAHYPGFIYAPAPNGYMYPISPLPTPPGHYPLHPAYAHAAGLMSMGHPSPYGPPPPPPLSHAPPPQYDQRPTRNSMTAATASPPHPALHHSLSAPSVPQLRQPPSPRNQGGQSQYPSILTTEKSPNVAPQIDPRLTEAVANASEASAKDSYRPEAQPAKPADPPVSGASQVPHIGTLVNGSHPTTVTPAASKPEQEGKRADSKSPGGNKDSVRPQDIPSEKLGFREDMRVLSKLDRMFAHV